MNLQAIDWAIMALLLGGMAAIAIRTKMLNRSVADFLAGNRCARRYLLTMADGVAGLGAITIAANFEKFYAAGFTAGWWGQIIMPIGLLMAISGFVIYRYRETRVLTMAQFFEVRYSRNFRIFSGILAFLSGILNYGIFPAVTSRFVIYFCGFPAEVTWLGFTMPTMAPVMFVMLSLALMLTLSGGQIAVIITDFFQGQFIQVTILVVFFVLLAQISWGELVEGLKMAPADQSMINPLKVSGIDSFNPAFFLMIAALNVYGFKAWQGSQGYNAAPRSPHEAKMASILGMLRGQVLFLLSMLVPLFVFAMMHLPEFQGPAEQVRATVDAIEDPQIQKQMLVPIGVSQLLPVGVMGMFAAMIVAAAVSTDDTYLHSWGSIFIQDVIMPFRKKPLGRKAHMLLLRGAIFGVAAFAFVFSLVFPLNEFILMYFQITAAIYLGGAGAAILGGLYWKRGSVEGAWAAMILGSVLSVTGIVLRNIIWPHLLPGWKEASPEVAWLQELPEEFPFHGVEMSFFVAIVACSAYILFSLLSKRPPINMDKLLNRGDYAVETEGHKPAIPAEVGHKNEASRAAEASGTSAAAVAESAEKTPSQPHHISKFWRRVGMTEEFTKLDRGILYFNISFTLLFFTLFLVGTPLAIIFNFSDDVWLKFWLLKVSFIVVVAIVATVWFSIGGVFDFFDMVRTLKARARDDSDDGWVSENEHLQKSE